MMLGKTFYPLTWVRYSAFMVLYPVGITGELVLFYKSIAVARDT